MTVNINDKNIGTIGYSIVADISDTVRDVLVREGMLRILQGPVASEYEAKAIALVFPNAADKDGKFSRKSLEAAIEAGKYPAFTDEDGKPRKFSRALDLPYSDELAAIWQKCCKGAEIVVMDEDKENKIAEVKEDLGISDVPTEKYEGAAKAEPKFAREKDFVQKYLNANGGKLQSGEPRTAATFSVNRGLPEPTEPWAEDSVWLAKVREWYVINVLNDKASEE